MATKKSVDAMSLYKNHMIRVRVDDGTLARLDFCCAATGLSKSDIIREGIDKKYRSLQRKSTKTE